MTDTEAGQGWAGSCHCGRIRFTVPRLPDRVTACNCSICRRYQAAWGYYRRRDVDLDIQDEAAIAYAWNDHMINFMHCRYCGCLTHYEDVKRTAESALVVNFHMVDPKVWQDIPVRHFDGADTFQEIS